ncbi:MAG: NHLP family bacteriocin export ABC transporter peptidase/permease/ATPase subunit [Clostridia bacterium]|nr:NHLP family bacteriocin export ABC transporter peptidase/permease/ATPase subunit [Clostridia bacterium]
MCKHKKGPAKVPVVMQMEALECGAASLCMILAYHGKWLPLEQVRAECGVSRDGSNAVNILKAARSYGLTAKGFKTGVDALKNSGTFPCIIFWNFNHFVVLCGFSGKYAYLNDPARGSIRVTMEEFDKAFTGVCLNFTPSENFEKSGKRKSTLAFARNRLKGVGAAVAFVMVLGMAAALLSAMSPAFSRFFTDRLLTGENTELLMPFIALVAGVSIFQILILAFHAAYSVKVNGKMAVIGSSSFMWKILRMPMEFFSQRMAGDIQLRHKANVEIAEMIVNTLAPLLLSAVMMVFYLVVMMRYSFVLTLIGLISVLINLFMSRLISEKRVNITRVSMRDEGKLAAATVSGIRMIETIKAGGTENGYFSRWAGFQASVNAQDKRFEELNQRLGIIPPFITLLTNSAVLIMGVWLCMKGEFTLGMVTAFQAFLVSFMNPAMTLITAGQTLQEMRTQMERVEDVLEYPEDTRVSGASGAELEEYEKLGGALELKNVTFGYSRLAEPLIENFSLSVKPGGRVAIVGASGCGKSTVAKLISGLYQPWSGEILFDGIPASDINRDIFTGSVAVVDQDVILFEDTIANNIKMWDSTIEDFEMIMAAMDAQIHEDIMLRPGGYQSKLTDGGRDISGGQRQRLEIARVLAQDPHIIIMDEATSALDARTEYELVKTVKRRGMTCIIIAHRLSTIRDCDEIIVLDHGKVVERGTHEELYAKGGYYTELISSD